MADELNRASARSQSALLEAMEERQVSADGTTMPLPRPFMVLATQNPFDAAGTSPLPAGQRDRFLLRLSLGYPSRAHEERLLSRAGPSAPVDTLGPALGRADLDALLQAVVDVHVSDAIRGYILDIVAASRVHPALAVGASPRGALALRQASCALALAAGRHYVVPSDVQRAVEPALGHRIVLLPGSERSGTGVHDVVLDLVQHSALPQPETRADARTGG
jgi:MoxR-like ATPase